MVTQGILEFVLFIVTPIIERLPTITITGEGISKALEIINGVLYFLPVNTILSILAIMLAIHVYRIIVSILKTLWGVLPVV